MKFTAEQRKQIIDQSAGKIIESMQWVDSDEYWVMKFTDGSEISFKFMAELI